MNQHEERRKKPQPWEEQKAQKERQQEPHPREGRKRQEHEKQGQESLEQKARVSSARAFEQEAASELRRRWEQRLRQAHSKGPS